MYTVPGGDTVQAVQTARALASIGVKADILLSNQTIAYDKYDLLHFFNITSPADILYHSQKTKKPFVVSTILCNYSEYDKNQRKGITSLLSYLPQNTVEYLKTTARWLLGRDNLASRDYLWKGQRKSILEVLAKTAMILPNSRSEAVRVTRAYPPKVNCNIITNGTDPVLFRYDPSVKKDDLLVICVARIEGIKNQYNLIKALNNTPFTLLLIGAAAPNQMDYYRKCREIAATNIKFINHIPQYELVNHYQRAKVHVLPSWFETTGLSSIEAAVMGCNIVITDKGDTVEYFGQDAFYCDASNPANILEAIQKASAAPGPTKLRDRILTQHTWKQAAIQTLKAYQLAATA
jgi:glycosyltransferase involved in cell wall biosynthesis